MRTESYVSDPVIRIGASWYPEMWPESEWPRDVECMRELGYNVTRLFEFAWRRLEPAEDVYDFDWAIRVLDLCHTAGIRVIAGTPTAAPPAWLTSRYPDVLRTAANGVRAVHGKRCHASPVSATYRTFAARIAGRMAETLAEHPALMAWQIDNEMSGYDYGPEAATRFRAWLKARYNTIDALNRAWGLEFWSQAYDSFDQVPLCIAELGAREVQERHHPSLLIAVAEFQNHAWGEFIRSQCDAIRAHSFKPITTNMVNNPGMNWFAHNRHLDVVGFSLYRDVVHYRWNTPCYDRMRAEKNRPYWLLETAPNWSAGGRIWNIHHDPRGTRLMTWMSLLLGGSAVVFWQWRQHWAGQEMLHGTLVTATGRRRPDWDAQRRLASEVRAQSDWLARNPPGPAQLAFLYDNRSAWALSIDPHDEDTSYDPLWRDAFYQPLVDAHYWREIIDADHDFHEYRVLIVPLLLVLRPEVRDRLHRWVESGGHLLLGPMSATRTPEMTIPTARELQGIEDWAGVELSTGFTPKWVEDSIRVEFEDGRASRTRVWCDGFTCTKARPLARYVGGYGDGSVAVAECSCGRGSVTLVGCPLEPAAYLGVARGVLARAGIDPLAEAPADVQVIPRRRPDGGPAALAFLNMALAPRTIETPFAGTDRLTGAPYPAGAPIVLAPLQPLLLEPAGT